MNKHTCEFCNKTFKTAIVLKNHKETTMRCLKLRGEIATKQYICEFCDKTFTQNSSLTTHTFICAEVKKLLALEKEKENSSLLEKLSEKEEENIKLKKIVKSLRTKVSRHEQDLQQNQEIIEKLQQENAAKDKKIVELEKSIEFGKGILIGYEKAKPTTVITTNTTSNTVKQRLASIKIDKIPPLTLDTIEGMVSMYTYEMYLQLEDGIVQFMKLLTQLEMEDGSIEQNYACTDKSRGTFHRLIESREWKIDGSAKSINYVFDKLVNQAEIYWNKFLNLAKHPADIDDQDYYAKKMIKLATFRRSLTCKGKDREESFQKVKSKMKEVSSI